MLAGEALVAAGIGKKVLKLSASVNFCNIYFAVSLVCFEVYLFFSGK